MSTSMERAGAQSAAIAMPAAAVRQRSLRSRIAPRETQEGCALRACNGCARSKRCGKTFLPQKPFKPFLLPICRCDSEEFLQAPTHGALASGLRRRRASRGEDIFDAAPLSVLSPRSAQSLSSKRFRRKAQARSAGKLRYSAIPGQDFAECRCSAGASTSGSHRDGLS